MQMELIPKQIVVAFAPAADPEPSASGELIAAQLAEWRKKMGGASA